jgi:hypothetical protein
MKNVASREERGTRELAGGGSSPRILDVEKQVSNDFISQINGRKGTMIHQVVSKLSPESSY